jgi:hypothetical protein
LNGDLASKLALLVKVIDRLPKPFAAHSNDTFFA